MTQDQQQENRVEQQRVPAAELAGQLAWHWENQARPRLAGLTDAEYFWEPVPGCWNVRPRGTSMAPVQGGSGDFTMDFAFPEPEPAPVTTIAWRVAHLLVAVLGMRNAAHFGGRPVSYEDFDYPGTAQEALELLDGYYAAWITAVSALSPGELAAPAGEAEGRWAQEPMSALVLHINREMIHHLAEIALLRDLYANGLR
ncbi:DinB family protein [Arthrobacter sp. zg-Y20]|uniref:DinB family protein n=1 Tax=unclassified Arthrobacter TaxID=235627 RepID=UPI001D1507F5|nr:MULTISPECIES: DinB family protein [unclassified Arthrobacter]MCC3276907.1 DinB family protein [Arthrobacter sp. zg-Y20]MDK1317068.1 DinB family protein [Arthrobacter sp. zg.Y20]WIB05223.1 DinB family protein [Arthrobacter sp. zg-Y20]